MCPTGRAIGAASVQRARAAVGAPHVIPSPHAAGLDQRLQPNAAPSVAADEVSLPQSVACCTAASTLYATPVSFYMQLYIVLPGSRAMTPMDDCVHAGWSFCAAALLLQRLQPCLSRRSRLNMGLATCKACLLSSFFLPQHKCNLLQ